VHDEAEARPRPPKLALRLLSKDVTARRAVRIIATVTVLFTIGGGALMRALDKEDFSSIGQAMWWSLQTVTTVGYGDVVPHNTEGRLIAAAVMLTGIGFIAVMTAAVTATLIESARRHQRTDEDAAILSRLEQIDARLAGLESVLDPKD
jgi:voltage-gated potassium channel